MENIFVEFLPPWIETGLQPAFYDKESGTVLQQTARMYARVNMLIRMFNKLSKNTKTTVEDYINKFNELHDYVHDYFDNLDVQEEINNKLDKMVEDGTLQEIVADYLNSKAVFGFDTVADMKSATNLIDGSYAETVGYHSKNDGGGTLYRIRNIVVGDVTNNNTLIQMNNPSLVAEMIVDKDELNVRQFGAYGDNTHDDTSAFQDAIDKAYETKIKVINIPEGVYLISQPLEIYENENYDLNMEQYDHLERHADLGYPVSKLTFQGVDMNNTMLKATAGDYLFNGYATTPVGIQDLTFNDIFFNGNNIAKTVLQMDIVHFGGRDIQFFRCNFNSFTECAIQDVITQAKINSAPLRNQLRLLIDNCTICNNKNGLIVGGDDTVITHCIIGKNEEYGIIFSGATHLMTVHECKIQYNGQSKTGYTGGQIKFSCAGGSFNLTNNYYENKSSNYTLNDTGIFIFTQNSADTGNSLIDNINIKNSYINAGGASCIGERIGNCTVVGLNIENNFITFLYSDEPYLFVTANDYLSTGGLSQQFRSMNNYVNARTTDSAHTPIYYFYLYNETSFARAGAVKAEVGLWTPNTTQDFVGALPTFISGMVGADGVFQYRKMGDYTVSKTGTGEYSITFTRPASLVGLSNSAAGNYPILLNLKLHDIHGDVYVTSRSVNGFTVQTGSWNNDFSAFTASDKAFQFIVTFFGKA